MAKRGNFQSHGPTKDGIHRFRITVSDEPTDAEILKWINLQEDLSFSIGNAIRMFIKAYGMIDYKVSVMELAASIMAQRGDDMLPDISGVGDSTVRASVPVAPKSVSVPPMTTGTDFGQAASIRPPDTKPGPAAGRRASGQFLE